MFNPSNVPNKGFWTFQNCPFIAPVPTFFFKHVNWQGHLPGSLALNACDLRALMQHSIKNQHDSIIDIIKWVEEHFEKSTVMAVCCYKQKPYINIHKGCQPLWVWAHLRWTGTKCKRMLWSDESTFKLF